jgi:hypothetical protein
MLKEFSGCDHCNLAFPATPHTAPRNVHTILNVIYGHIMGTVNLWPKCCVFSWIGKFKSYHKNHVNINAW